MQTTMEASQPQRAIFPRLARSPMLGRSNVAPRRASWASAPDALQSTVRKRSQASRTGAAMKSGARRAPPKRNPV
jgi:hypothetical protein